MTKKNYQFSTAKVDYYFNAEFGLLEKLAEKQQTVLVTDENVYEAHKKKFKSWKLIVVKPGEEHKIQSTANDIIEQLIEFGADRGTTLVGVGGGVITDLTGYVAAIYMRGLKFGFLPTTILAMVDASIGGKNGVDVGIYKNLVGTIRQPEFLLYDYSFLQTLPQTQWINGFAEVIKHACIKDAELFGTLENNSLDFFQTSSKNIDALIKRNVAIKCNVVSNDEFETGERKLLNFGHTLGHAIENIYELPHGNAVSIGMVAACGISNEINNFSSGNVTRVKKLLKKYHLPVELDFNTDEIWEVLLMEKKKTGDTINFILLNRIGEAIIKPVLLNQLRNFLKQPTL